MSNNQNVVDEEKQRRLAVARAWKDRNKERVKEARAAYYAANKKRERETNQEWLNNHPDWSKTTKLECNRKYWAENKTKLAESRKRRRPLINEQQRRRYASDDAYAVEKRLRASMSQAVRKAGVRKSAHAFDLIGCSPQELVAHIEKQFLAGMFWENRSRWHIDHKRPVSSFDLSDPEQQKACFHFSNLQPLWAEDNLKKSDKMP